MKGFTHSVWSILSAGALITIPHRIKDNTLVTGVNGWTEVKQAEWDEKKQISGVIESPRDSTHMFPVKETEDLLF